MTKPKAPPARPDPDLAELAAQEQALKLIFDALGALEQLRTTDGIVDLGVLAPGETVYRVPDAKGEVHEYTVPNDLPFELALDFLAVRDAFAKTEQAVEGVEDRRDPKWKAYRRSWTELMVILQRILAIRHPDITMSDLESIGRNYRRNWIGAIWLMLLGARLKPFADEQGESVPKGPVNRAARRRAQKAKAGASSP
jgi:hypothetical protein